MRPVISQSQAAFVRTMQPTLTQVVTNQAVIQAGQRVMVTYIQECLLGAVDNLKD